MDSFLPEACWREGCAAAADQRPEIANALLEVPVFFVGAALSLAGRRAGEALWPADSAMACFALT